MKVSIDRSACTGHGLCYMTAPDVYEDDDQGYGQVIAGGGEVDGEAEDAARQGADNCPERAISVD